MNIMMTEKIFEKREKEFKNHILDVKKYKARLKLKQEMKEDLYSMEYILKEILSKKFNKSVVFSKSSIKQYQRKLEVLLIKQTYLKAQYINSGLEIPESFNEEFQEDIKLSSALKLFGESVERVFFNLKPMEEITLERVEEGIFETYWSIKAIEERIEFIENIILFHHEQYKKRRKYLNSISKFYTNKRFDISSKITKIVTENIETEEEKESEKEYLKFDMGSLSPPEPTLEDNRIILS